MNITPTTLHRAQFAPTPVAVYYITEQKNILLFSSINLCVEYLFSHRIKSPANRKAIHGRISLCCKRKYIEDINMFSLPFTYRAMNDNQKKRLGDNDFLILDERFINDDYKTGTPTLRGLKLEDLLKSGDKVRILDGKFKDRTGRISDIKKTSHSGTKARFEYLIAIDGKLQSFRAYCLQQA